MLGNERRVWLCNRHRPCIDHRRPWAGFSFGGYRGSGCLWNGCWRGALWRWIGLRGYGGQCDFFGRIGSTFGDNGNATFAGGLGNYGSCRVRYGGRLALGITVQRPLPVAGLRLGCLCCPCRLFGCDGAAMEHGTGCAAHQSADGPGIQHFVDKRAGIELRLQTALDAGLLHRGVFNGGLPAHG